MLPSARVWVPAAKNLVLLIHTLSQPLRSRRPPAPRAPTGPGPHVSGLDRATGLGGTKSKTIVEEKLGRKLSISSQGVPLELRAKAFCDFSLWSLTNHLPKICREASHSKAEMLLYKHLQQKRMFFSSGWTLLFIFKQYLNKRCCSFHCKMGRNFKRRGNWPNSAWRSPVLSSPPPMSAFFQEPGSPCARPASVAGFLRLHIQMNS